MTYTGAKPVFVDIDPQTWCIDPDSARRSITPRTKAIMPVHLYGHPADMRAIRQLADGHGLSILEDAAPALGAEVEGRKVGSFGDIACFSFQGAKIMTCGEGGMLVTDNRPLMERARYFNDHCRDPEHPLRNTAIGYKYKMSNLQAALGLGQIERIEEMVAKRRIIYQWYSERLAGVPDLALNVERSWARNIYWMTSIVLGESHAIDRDEVISDLKRHDIDSRPFFAPLSSFPMFTSRQNVNRTAYAISQRGINLPSGHNLMEADVDRVCECLRAALARSACANALGRVRECMGDDAVEAAEQDRILATIKNLKMAATSSGNWFAVFDRDECMTSLDPVTWGDVDDADSIRLLSQWRAAAQNSFPAIFPVSQEGTRRWLAEQVLEIPDRLLFWVKSPSGAKIGHAGIFRIDFAERNLELDNVVRGVPRIMRGAMYSSVQAILSWVFTTLGMNDVFLRVFSDNGRAIQLYEHCGFRETMRMPLRREQEGDVIRWREVDGGYRKPVERYFVTMHLSRATWQTDCDDELAA